MEREFLTLFGFSLEQVEKLISIITEELKIAVLEQSTINGVKTACLTKVIERIGESSPEHYAAAGVMVEQAYNAAVAASKKQLERKK